MSLNTITILQKLKNQTPDILQKAPFFRLLDPDCLYLEVAPSVMWLNIMFYTNAICYSLTLNAPPIFLRWRFSCDLEKLLLGNDRTFRRHSSRTRLRYWGFGMLNHFLFFSKAKGTFHCMRVDGKNIKPGG